ncbi:putative RNA recognition motif domain, nucleotide-binding alpha-beta plait domain superfamily [Helianthus debilis subsp. tardiflorus]
MDGGMNERQGEVDNGGPWNHVQYRKNRRSRGDGVEWTFLIQNLSEQVNRNILWRAFQAYGFISDVYVARKRDARGRCFGFVRYVGVEHVNETLASMNTVKMFGMKANVSLAKYDKDHNKINYSSAGYSRSEWRPKGTDHSNANNTSGNKDGEQPVMKTKSYVPIPPGPSLVQEGRSFADLVRGNAQEMGKGAKVITVEGKGSLYPLHCIGRSIIGHAKEILPIRDIRRTLMVGRLGEVGLSYIGGVMFMITCNNKESARNYLEQQSSLLHKVFSKFYLWNGEDIPSSRLVTLSILGVPFLIRDGPLFDRFGSQFGEVIQESSFSWQNENNESGSVKIVTTRMSKIDEAVVIKWNEKTATAWVSEGCVQSPFDCDIDSEDDDSDSELESESEGDDQTEDMADVEEGEIRQNSTCEGDLHDKNQHPGGIRG